MSRWRCETAERGAAGKGCRRGVPDRVRPLDAFRAVAEARRMQWTHWLLKGIAMRSLFAALCCFCVWGGVTDAAPRDRGPDGPRGRGLLFSRFDKNNDGSISRREWRRGWQELQARLERNRSGPGLRGTRFDRDDGNRRRVFRSSYSSRSRSRDSGRIRLSHSSRHWGHFGKSSASRRDTDSSRGRSALRFALGSSSKHREMHKSDGPRMHAFRGWGNRDHAARGEQRHARIGWSQRSDKKTESNRQPAESRGRDRQEDHRRDANRGDAARGRDQGLRRSDDGRREGRPQSDSRRPEREARAESTRESDRPERPSASRRWPGARPGVFGAPGRGFNRSGDDR